MEENSPLASLRLKDVTISESWRQRILGVPYLLRFAEGSCGLQFHAARIDSMMFGLNNSQDGIHGHFNLRIRI